jgi:hypothetical protein
VVRWDGIDWGGRVLEAWWELPLLLDSVALIIHDLVALIGNPILL